MTVPNGLVLLMGPPAAGKTSFASAWIERGWLDAEGVVSCDTIRRQMCGDRFDVSDDPLIFDEMDRQVAGRLEAALAVVVDATNVLPQARSRMIAWARQYGRPITALRFQVSTEVLVHRNSARLGNARVPEGGITVVIDVPGEAEGMSPTQAAATIRLAA